MEQEIKNPTDSNADSQPVIFVVDNNTVFRRLTCHILEQDGIYATAEADGETGVRQLLESVTPVLILVGIRLKDIGGMSLLRKLKEDPAVSGIPVVICARHPTQSLRSEALQAGATDVVSKEIKDEKLLDLVGRFSGVGKPAERSGDTGGPNSAPTGDISSSAAVSLVRVLVVEDSPLMMRILSTTLVKEGSFQVMEAGTGAAALEAVHKEIPDLILLDINLPDTDGLEILKSLKANPVTESIPVIMCTSHRDQPTVERAVALGAADYIVKPINSRLMISKLQIVMERQGEEPGESPPPIPPRAG